MKEQNEIICKTFIAKHKVPNVKLRNEAGFRRRKAHFELDAVLHSFNKV